MDRTPQISNTTATLAASKKSHCELKTETETETETGIEISMETEVKTGMKTRTKLKKKKRSIRKSPTIPKQKSKPLPQAPHEPGMNDDEFGFL
jgi:hypothetical protein